MIFIPIIPVLGRIKEKNKESKITLGYIKTVSQKKKTIKYPLNSKCTLLVKF